MTDARRTWSRRHRCRCWRRTNADFSLLAAQYSLSSFELSSAEFHPYDSKFDFFLKGKVMLSQQELRGYSLFNRPDKGNCAGCHPSTRQADGSPPVFTDYTYDNLGVPRNAEIPANADPAYFDMGLCGPDRTDLANRKEFCGQFKVPTLRNVATRQAIFHNGNFHKLKDALQFYVQRDTNPEKFYPLDAEGVPEKFNDVPPLLTRNVNVGEAPYNRHPGDAPALSDDEIDDVIAFLKTLTDGYDPATDSADPAQLRRPVAPRLLRRRSPAPWVRRRSALRRRRQVRCCRRIRLLPAAGSPRLRAPVQYHDS